MINYHIWISFVHSFPSQFLVRRAQFNCTEASIIILFITLVAETVFRIMTTLSVRYVHKFVE